MMTKNQDNELKSIIQGIPLDSPGKDFTLKVMQRVYEEKTAGLKVADEKLFGKGFWIILALFALLALSMFLVYVSGNDTGTLLSEFWSKSAGGGISQKYDTFFSNLGSLPVSIGGILLASSILVIIDKFLPQVLTHPSRQNLL